MRISAKAEYAVRAAAELATGGETPMPAEALARAAGVPHRFLEGILTDLRREGLVLSRRGAGGGHLLARPAERVTIADVIRAVEGPLVFVRDERPGEIAYQGAAALLPQVWVALRANVRAVLEQVTLADLAAGHIPALVAELTADEDAWRNP
ncbi:RrF2 family transcriptional regulator [Ruania rhizosphaerae]|uniref:RrF2 family transcriptional regulator n=1 Tax=Ruania rhizosphaerae TaxID=1840413 RepID=UPI00135AB1C2|nr:Rrf2 family transcriptional regulator [Ruania rhizosphaerae]